MSDLFRRVGDALANLLLRPMGYEVDTDGAYYASPRDRACLALTALGMVYENREGYVDEIDVRGCADLFSLSDAESDQIVLFLHKVAAQDE